MSIITPPEPYTTNPMAIATQGVTKRYGLQVACDGIDFTLPLGKTFGLLGPNGAGKSTFIRMLMGLTTRDTGRISVLGCSDLRSSELRQRVGYVPELHFMYRWMTIQQVLEFVRPLYIRWDRELASELLDRFGLPTQKRVGSLSKGMTAKLGLLLALAHHPELLILDEPTSGLDPIIREDFLESVLKNSACKNRTILFSSHHVDDVERVSDEVGIMVNGKLLVRGSPDELRQRTKRLRLVLPDGRLPAETPREMLSQRLQRREWLLTVDPYSPELVARLEMENKPVSLAVIELSLEEIFKDHVRGLESLRRSDP